MLVNNVDLFSNNLVRHIPLSFRDQNSDMTYRVKSITGLDADEIVARYTGNPDNGFGFNVPTLMKREVVILLGLNPWLDPTTTFSSLRDDVYKLMCGCRTGAVQIWFNYNADRTARLVGFVTKVEMTHFTKTPEIQLTINCDNDVMLKGHVPIDILPDTVIAGQTATVTDSLSTAVHGFKIDVRFSGDSSWFEMTGPAGWKFRVDYGFQAGDRLYISSETNDKYVYVIRSGVTTQLANKVSANSIWPQMLPGSNLFTFTSGNGVEVLGGSHYATYWGI